MSAQNGISESFWLGDCLVEPAFARVTQGGTCTTLDAQPLRLLLLLTAHSGELLDYEAIEQHIWQDSALGRESLYQVISQLRRALGDDPRAPRHIKTIPRKGYLLVSRARPHVATATLEIAQQPATPRPRKWHWWPGVAAVLLLTLIMIYLHLSGQEHRRVAARERQRAEQVSRFMVGSFPVQQPGPDASRQPTLAADVLIQSEQRLAVDLSGQPQLQAQMLQAIGTTYRRQGRHEQAFAALSRARSLYAREERDSPLQLAKLNSELSMAARDLGRVDASLDYLGEAAQELRAADRTRSREYAWVLADRALLSSWRGRPEEGLRDFNDALRLMNELEGDGSSSSAGILGNMSHLYLWIDDPATAERVARKSVSIYRNTLPPLHPDRIMAEHQLGSILPHQGQLREAEELLQNSLVKRQQLFGARGALVAESLLSLGELHMLQQHWVEAEDFIRQSISAYSWVSQRPTQLLVYMETSLAFTVLNQGRYREATSLLTEAIVLCKQISPLNTQYLASAEHFLGEAQLAAHDFKAAEQTLNLALQHWKQAGATPWRTARTRNTLGEVLLRTGRRAAGIELLRESERQLLQDRTADRFAQKQATARVERLLGTCRAKSPC